MTQHNQTCNCGHPLTPIRASNRRRQRMGGKAVQVKEWVCRNPYHDAEGREVPFFGRGETK